MTCENYASFNWKSPSCILTVLLLKRLHSCWDPIYIDRLHWRGPPSVSILRFGVASVAVVYCTHPELPDSVLAISCASQGWENSKNIVSMFLRLGDLGSRYLHGKCPWKNQRCWRKVVWIARQWFFLATQYCISVVERRFLSSYLLNVRLF